MMTLRPARRWRLSRRCSGPPACNSGSPVRHFDAEQRAIVLAAEDVGIARAAARAGAADREFDREGGVELDVIGNAVVLDAEKAAHGLARQRAAPPHMVVIGAGGKDHIERDTIDPGILAADRLRDLAERPPGITRPPPSPRSGTGRAGRP